MLTMSRTKYFFFGLLFCLVFVVHSPALHHNLFLDRDDYELVLKVKDVNSLEQYLELGKTNGFFFLQPLRFLSWKIDFLVSDLIQFDIHHFHSILIWFLICLIVYFIFGQTSQNEKLSRWFILVFALYPTFVPAIAWLSARKHLLSLFFLSLLLLVFLKSIKKSKANPSLMACLFLGSCLSHAINILWPIWAVYYSIQKGKNLKQSFSNLWPCFVMALILIVANVYFTVFVYEGQTGSRKVNEQWQLIISLLALGRNFYQLIWPWDISVTYYPYSPEGVVGLIFLCFFMYIVWKLKLKEFVQWGFLSFLAILPVTLFQTNIFVSDTYLLVFSLGFFIALLNFIDQRSFVTHLKFNYVAILIVSILATKSFMEAKNWSNSQALAKVSAVREPTCMNYKMDALYSFREGHINQGLLRANQFIKLKCISIPLTNEYLLVLYSIMYDERLSLQSKLQKIKGLNIETDYVQLAKIKLYLQLDQNVKADQLMETFLKKDFVYNRELIFKKDYLIDRIYRLYRARHDQEGQLITFQIEKIRDTQKYTHYGQISAHPQ